MTSTVEFGDLYICLFPFTSGKESKARPVLILKDLGSDCLVCRVTSVPHRSFLDLPVTDLVGGGFRETLHDKAIASCHCRKTPLKASDWKIGPS